MINDEKNDIKSPQKIKLMLPITQRNILAVHGCRNTVVKFFCILQRIIEPIINEMHQSNQI